jgi:hypothetical protein
MIGTLICFGLVAVLLVAFVTRINSNLRARDARLKIADADLGGHPKPTRRSREPSTSSVVGPTGGGGGGGPTSGVVPGVIGPGPASATILPRGASSEQAAMTEKSAATTRPPRREDHFIRLNPQEM